MSQHEGQGGTSARVGDREIARLVRNAALGAYGVASVSGPRWIDALLGKLGLSVPGVRLDTAHGLRVEIHLALVEGVPARAVASNVEEGVRYIVQRELGLTIDDLTIVVDGRPVNAQADDGSTRHQG